MMMKMMMITKEVNMEYGRSLFILWWVFSCIHAINNKNCWMEIKWIKSQMQDISMIYQGKMSCLIFTQQFLFAHCMCVKKWTTVTMGCEHKKVTVINPYRLVGLVTAPLPAQTTSRPMEDNCFSTSVCI